jgi:uncharacterized protein YigE (DUF2233 family)
MAAIRSSLFPILILIAACGESGEPAPAPPPREVAVAGHCETKRFEATGFTVCRYDASRHELILAVDDSNGPMRSFAALGRTLGPRRSRLLFAMNAGMYDDQGMPIGLYVEAGRRRHTVNLRPGPGNFHMRPNGVFAVGTDGQVAVVRSDRLASLPWQPHWATQSGPMLVVEGRLHPSFQPNGPSLHIRNGVGVDSPGTAWFAISDEPVSFGRFARFFRDALHCPNALFFDGTVSSLWDPAARRQDDDYPIGPMVAVLRRQPAQR